MDWRTPANLLDVVRRFAPIGLDPCGAVGSLVEARVTYLYPPDDGLVLGWGGPGMAYVNPPYGRETSDWVAKMRVEAALGVEIVALVAARPDTVWFQDSGVSLVCFWRGRLRFVGAESPAPFPSAVLYYGLRGDRFAEVFREYGVVVPWSKK